MQKDLSIGARVAAMRRTGFRGDPVRAIEKLLRFLR